MWIFWQTYTAAMNNNSCLCIENTYSCTLEIQSVGGIQCFRNMKQLTPPHGVFCVRLRATILVVGDYLNFVSLLAVVVYRAAIHWRLLGKITDLVEITEKITGQNY